MGLRFILLWALFAVQGVLGFLASNVRCLPSEQSPYAYTAANGRCRTQKGAAKHMSMKLSQEDEEVFYSLGAGLALQVEKFRSLMNAEEAQAAMGGFNDAFMYKPLKYAFASYAEKVNKMLKERTSIEEMKIAVAGREFLDAARNQPGAVVTKGGAVVQEITAGTGASPQATDKVKVHYTGTLISGKVFDSSVERGQPISFPLNGVITGWTEGLQLMKVGGKSRLVIPPELAYGEEGSGPVPANATLVFEVELLAIE